MARAARGPGSLSLRARQRARPARQRRARPRLPLPPAAREGQGPRSSSGASARRRTSRSGWEEVAHGYDLDGKQVVLTDEELASVQPRKTRTIDIEAFVELADVDPIYFDHPVLPRPRRRERGHAARLPAAGRGDGARPSARARPVRDAHQGVPRRGRASATARSPSRRCASTTRSADRDPAGGKKPAKAARPRVAMIEELPTGSPSATDCYRERLGGDRGKRKRRKIEAPENRSRPRPDGGARAPSKELPGSRATS